MENGRWVVNAAVSGISAFVDPSGRIVAEAGLFRTAILRHTIRSSDVVTPYVRLGDWFPWLSLVVVAAMVLVPRKRSGVRPAPSRCSPDRRRTLVVLPTYEERDTIEWVLARLLDLPERVDVLVVDDSSPDGTGDLVARRGGRRAPGAPARACAEVGARERVPGRVPGRRSTSGTTCSSRWTPTSPMRRRSSPRLLAAAGSDRDLVVGSRYVTGWLRHRLEPLARRAVQGGQRLRTADAGGPDPRRDERLPGLPPPGARRSSWSGRSTRTATGSRSSW